MTRKILELLALALSSLCLALAVASLIYGFTVFCINFLAGAFAAMYAAYCFHE